MSDVETSDQERLPRVWRKLAQLLVMQLQDELGRWEERFAGTQVGAAQEAAGQPDGRIPLAPWKDWVFQRPGVGHGARSAARCEHPARSTGIAAPGVAQAGY